MLAKVLAHTAHQQNLPSLSPEQTEGAVQGPRHTNLMVLQPQVIPVSNLPTWKAFPRKKLA